MQNPSTNPPKDLQGQHTPEITTAWKCCQVKDNVPHLSKAEDDPTCSKPGCCIEPGLPLPASISQPKYKKK